MTEECLYCRCQIENADTVPAINDDEAWEKLAVDHADDCEWILTRAHRRQTPVETADE